MRNAFAPHLRILAAIAVAAACAIAVPLYFSHASATPPAAAAKSFVIRHARIFDGERLISAADVSVENGRIAAVGKNLKVPPGTEEINASGDTLLPGLIDAHAHPYLDALQQALLFGVTTELSMFSDVKFDADVHKREAAGQNLDAADLRSSGTLVTVPGGHGTEYGIPIPTLTSAAQAQSFVDARLAEGSDYIKIIYDDGSAYGLKSPTLSKEELAAVVAAAHLRHKIAIVHIGSEAGARDAIEAGADGLAHTFEDEPPSPDFIALLKKHHAFVVPTLSVNESVAGLPAGASLVSDPRLSPYLDASVIANLKKTFPRRATAKTNFDYALASVRDLHAAGVPILAGTDAPNPGTAHGLSLHGELELLVKAGLTPSEALAAATSVPARIFSLPDRGRIASGLRADLLLVKGDPTQDITDTRDIVAVWKTGVQLDRAAYRAQVEKDRKASEEAAKAPAPSGSESGLISDFETDTSAKFGAGWTVSTDSIAGGKSTGEMKRVDGGANGSSGSLLISGNISADLPYAWAGAMFSPGTQPFQPANLSSKKAIHFWARGDRRTYRVMVFTQSGGYMPTQQTFVAGPDWKEFTFPFADFGGTDGYDVTAIIFAAGVPAGSFQFYLDDVRLDP
ncbi:MAG TPA: CIA30 family protein [Candidatus Methylomirabilis sp.]|nr:CIA30 family protein [Candidatus Methylomirabilis sp.]